MREQIHPDTPQDGSASQRWYGFLFDVFGDAVTEATLLRLFFAPIYLVYALETPKTAQLSAQQDWLERYQKVVEEAVLEDDPAHLPHQQLMDRVRQLERLLSCNVRETTGQLIHSYFSKNRVVHQFPERFAAAIFPVRRRGLQTDLMDYYLTLISKLFSGFPALLDACIARLEERNRNTPWFRVPTPDRGSRRADNDGLVRAETAAELLCSFAILSAAYAIDADPKKAARQRVIPNIFAEAQRLLEICSTEPDQQDDLSIPLTREQLLTLCTCAADSRNANLIRCLEEICKGCPSPGSAGSGQRQNIHHLLQKLRQYNIDCAQRIHSEYDKYYDDISLMGSIAKLEAFWKQQLRSPNDV